MDYYVLGPLRVFNGDDRISLSGEAQRRLLCLLVLRANTIVPSEQLEDHLHLSAGALRTSVCRLRRVVGYDSLVTAPPGYELRTECVDAMRFERLLTVASTAGRDDARSALEDALALWRGDAYAEFAADGWAAAEARRLDELRAGAVERLVEILLDDHEWASATARIEALVSAHPFRDRPRELLMQALASSGRRADALRAFQAYRNLLQQEIGTEPSNVLVQLDRTIASAR